MELLNELRVALPGAQFLFAFLLTVPFASGFADVSRELRLLFYCCLLSNLTATVLLMAPTIYHRARWRRGDKARVVRVGHLLFVAGMMFLGLAMWLAVWFVSDALLGHVAALVAATVGAAVLALTWCVLPLSARRKGFVGERDPDDDATGP